MKYAELIRAVLDGKKIQIRFRTNQEALWGAWRDCGGDEDIRLLVANMAAEYTTMDYRLAPPPPPPDVVRFRPIGRGPQDGSGYLYLDHSAGMRLPYEKITWDGATGEVKSVELIK